MDGFLALFSFRLFFSHFDIVLYIGMINYYILITYYFLYSILVGPIRIGLTFTRASSARPSRQLGFPTDVVLLLLVSYYHPFHPWK